MAKAFLKSFVLIALAGSVIVSALNYLVDPYSLFGTPHMSGFNANKLEFVEHLRLTNVYAVRRIEPDALIIGTSRAGRGLRPTHSAWLGLTCYNLSMPALTAFESLRYLQYAMARHPVKRVLLGLDFRYFQEQHANEEMERRLAVDAQGKAQFNLFTALLPDMASSLLSGDALLDSLRTMRYQSWQNMTLTDRGHWLSLTDHYNHAKGFRVYTANTFKRYAEFAEHPIAIERSMEPFRKILELAHRGDVDLRLAILPSHAWHWESLRLSGLEPRFAEIREALVRINRDEAEKWHRAPFPLWDFSGFNSYSTEAVPSDSGQSMQWFWDPVHFKPTLGDLLQDRVFGLEAKPDSSNFGVRLDGADITAHLAYWRQAEQAYRGTHQQDLQEIESILHRGPRGLAAPAEN